MAARATVERSARAGRCGLAGLALLCISLGLALSLGLSACGGGAGAEAAAAPPLQPPPVAADFKLLPVRVGLLVGGQGAMRALQAPAVIAWSSSNPAVAEVDSTGLVTARGAGSALISATAGAQSASASVTVHASTATTAVALIDQALAQSRITPERR